MSTRLAAPLLAPELACPSAPADIPGAVAFGVIDHRASPPEVMYLDQTVPVSAELLHLSGPLEPGEVFRFGAPCQTERCSHWSGSACTLVERIVTLVPVASLTTPACRIRPSCRWYAQAGRNACMRCPHVVTKDEQPSAPMRAAARARAAEPLPQIIRREDGDQTHG
jgi:hypothetical protein